MLMDGMDGRVLVVSASEPRYALHAAILHDGRKLDIKEDLWQTPEHRNISISSGEGYAPSPRFYVTNVRLPSGESLNPKDTTLPNIFKLSDGTIVRDFVCYVPGDD